MPRVVRCLPYAGVGPQPGGEASYSHSLHAVLLQCELQHVRRRHRRGQHMEGIPCTRCLASWSSGSQPISSIPHPMETTWRSRADTSSLDPPLLLRLLPHHRLVRVGQFSLSGQRRSPDHSRTLGGRKHSGKLSGPRRERDGSLEPFFLYPACDRGHASFSPPFRREGRSRNPAPLVAVAGFQLRGGRVPVHRNAFPGVRNPVSSRPISPVKRL